MCGRYTLSSDADVLMEQFGLSGLAALTPRYNIAPSQPVLAVRQRDDGGRDAKTLRWGLIPSWAKDPAVGHRLINARSETAAEKPSFRSAFRHRRCLVPADGFYEWAARPGAGKQPWYFHAADRRPLAIAGLWERWQQTDGETVESCSLLTTHANAVVAPVHHRMPVMLSAPDYAQWLDGRHFDQAALQALMRPLPDRLLSAYAVSTRVNRPVNDDPDCIRPLPTNRELSFDE